MINLLRINFRPFKVVHVAKKSPALIYELSSIRPPYRQFFSKFQFYCVPALFESNRMEGIRKWSLIKELHDLCAYDFKFWSYINNDYLKGAENFSETTGYEPSLSFEIAHENISRILKSNNMRAAKFLYAKYPEIFRVDYATEELPNPFIRAHPNSIAYFIENHSDDSHLMNRIAEARRSFK